jgi:molybdopterin/thiamine biosynthesis adenylyltransferase
MSELSEAVRAGAETLRGPGHVDWRVISPVTVGEIARTHERSRREVEIAALEAGIVPLHYMRNIARFAVNGQLDLLRANVAIVGAGPVVETCLQRLAAYGVGGVRVLAPEGMPSPDYDLVARPVANVNAAVQTETGVIDLRRGDPTAVMRGVDLVAACLDDAMDETLLQSACRRLEVPLVCAGLQESAGQATAIFPGDAGMARVYRPDHPHLERSRPGGSLVAGQAALVVGSWMADQVVAVCLGTEEVLRNKLLFADLATGQMETIDL